MLNDEANKLFIDTNKQFLEQTRADKEQLLKKFEAFLITQKDSLRDTLTSKVEDALMNDKRVMRFASMVYTAAGERVIRELQKSYEEKLNNLMTQVDLLKRETIVFSTHLNATNDEQKTLKHITRVLDIMLVLISGGLSVISLYPKPISVTILSSIVLLIVIGVRFWNEWATIKNQERMKKGLDQSNLNEIYDRITEQRNRLANTLSDYVGQHQAQAESHRQKESESTNSPK